MGRLGLNGVCGQIRGLPEAEALRLAFLLELHRTFGLHLLRLDLAVSRLCVGVVARQVVVLALDFGNLLQPRVVGTLLGAEVVSQRRELRELPLGILELRREHDVRRIVCRLDGVGGQTLVWRRSSGRRLGPRSLQRLDRAADPLNVGVIVSVTIPELRKLGLELLHLV